MQTHKQDIWLLRRGKPRSKFVVFSLTVQVVNPIRLVNNLITHLWDQTTITGSFLHAFHLKPAKLASLHEPHHWVMGDRQYTVWIKLIYVCISGRQNEVLDDNHWIFYSWRVHRWLKVTSVKHSKMHSSAEKHPFVIQALSLISINPQGVYFLSFKSTEKKYFPANKFTKMKTFGGSQSATGYSTSYKKINKKSQQ